MREKAQDAQTYDVEDSESEPEPDKEAHDGATKAESPMVAYLEQMFTKRLDAMQSMVERLLGEEMSFMKSGMSERAALWHSSLRSTADSRVTGFHRFILIPRRFRPVSGGGEEVDRPADVFGASLSGNFDFGL
ncbi:hypothetical protein Bca52824_073436 [Brassica carinata]|uniref:Uncharacterized protein n=1 Tax=Brassica carinata TaxID=52824 RepID=A0A8X7U588_BRACI|nr:hypothetical protein Bca52824_073436 [Brassica carinata]